MTSRFATRNCGEREKLLSSRRRTAITIIVAAGVVAFAMTAQAAQVTVLTLSPPKATLKVGNSVSFNALANFEDGSSRDVTGEASWAPSSNFTGKQEGIFYIAATYQGKKAVATVTVEGGRGPKAQKELIGPAGAAEQPEERTTMVPAPAIGADFGGQFEDREQQRREERSLREQTDSSGSFYGREPGKGRTTPEDLRNMTEGFAGRGQDSKLKGMSMRQRGGNETVRYYVIKKASAGTWRNSQCTLTTFEVLSAGDKEFPSLFSEVRRRFELDNRYCRENGCDSGGPGGGASRDWKPQEWDVTYQGPLDHFPQNLPAGQRNCTGEMR